MYRWIGVLFTELEGYSDLDVLIYYVQHIICAFAGTIVFSLSRRFDILAYWSWPHFMYGLIMFSYYMRPVLTPVALLTWANLNHALCGTDSDPFWLHLNLGKWYYALGEFYLSGACAAFFVINHAICYLIRRVLLADQSCSHGDPYQKHVNKGGGSS